VLNQKAGTQDRGTLVEGLIAQFERDLTDGRFAPGGFMGTREDLCAAYGVTSPIFFQASRVLVHRGLAELRPGNRGGLFACDHSVERVGKRVATYLECTGVDFDDVAPVSRLLQELCVRMATGWVRVEAARTIRATMARVMPADTFERGRLLSYLFQQFADASGNVILALLHRVSTEVMLDVSAPAATAEQDAPTGPFLDLGARMAEAVIAGDHALVAELYQQFREAVARRRRSSRDLPLPDFANRDAAARNLPERLALYMLKEIQRAGWPAGEKLGNEPELLQRYGVSRATLRQALRLLEEYSAVETRRGPKGGVMIASPNPDVVTQTALALLTSRCATLEMSRSLLVSLMTLAVELAFARGETGRRAIAEACRDTSPELHGDLTRFLLEQGRVRALDLFVRLLGEFEQTLEELRSVPGGGRYGRVAAALAQAAEADDLAVARCAVADLTRSFGVGRLPAFR